MSLDTVAPSSSASRADAARNASVSLASRNDASANSGDFAALMQGLGDHTPAADPLASKSQDRNDKQKSSSSDASQGNADAAASAAANAVAAQQSSRDASSGNRGRDDTGKESATRTEAASGDSRQTGQTHGAGGTSEASGTTGGNGTNANGSVTEATQAADGSSSYLRQVAFLQQLADAAAQAGANTGVGGAGQTGAANGALAAPAQVADAAAQRLQTLLADAAQAVATGTQSLAPAAGPDAMTTLALAGVSDGTGRSLGRTSASDARTGADSAAVALMGATTSATDVRFDVPAAAPDAGATTEMRVAQQVTYWVGKGVQNAAMEVQGIAEKPIHVSIAVQGQEARVTLQAEQLQTQQILQASAPHLRELLQTQGMVLSSLTVGGSGAGATGDGSGNAASRDSSGTRQGQVLVPEATAAITGASGSGRSGSALDLFV